MKTLNIFYTKYSIFLFSIALFTLSSCSNSDDSVEGCPEDIINRGTMLIEAPDFTVPEYSDMTYAYIDNEGLDEDGNFVYQLIYSNYDIESSDPVTNGYYLRFRIVSPDGEPDGEFSLNNTGTRTISDIKTFYDFTTFQTIGNVTPSTMTVTFSNFDSCFNHTIDIKFEDTEAIPSIIGTGSFTGVSKIVVIGN